MTSNRPNEVGAAAPGAPRHARRDFLRLAALAGVAYAGGPILASTAVAEPVAPAVPPEFPRQADDAVRDVVAAAHSDLERVRALVSARPALARASWDWGFGDWESPLGAASHMGRRDIAELLMAHGARPNVFSAAMLGQVAVVRAFVEASPALAAIEGPHGIPLIAHARAGGDAAQAVVAYLEGLPAAAKGDAPPELGDVERASLLGTYAFGDGPGETLEVTERNGQLRIGRNGSNRNLFRVEGLSFRPAGAREVRVTFRVDAGSARAVTVHDGPLVVQAVRRES